MSCSKIERRYLSDGYATLMINLGKTILIVISEMSDVTPPLFLCDCCGDGTLLKA